MKRIISLVLVLAVLFLASGCDGTEQGGPISAVPKILSPMEYTLYLNVFYNGQALAYEDEEYTKDGVFGILKDSYTGIERYDVWGYSDETLCCDWQWEFVPKDGTELPKPGSHVKVTGTLVKNDGALDGYWLENADVELIEEFVAGYGDVDMTTLSPTLTRVQLIFMINRMEQFAGSIIRVYGRVMSGNRVQHPYYDSSWYLDVEYDEAMPSIGSYVTITGEFTGTSSNDVRIKATLVEVG